MSDNAVFEVSFYDLPGRRLTLAGATLSRRLDNGRGIWRLEAPRPDGALLELEGLGGPMALPKQIGRALPAFLRGDRPEQFLRLRIHPGDDRNDIEVLEGMPSNGSLVIGPGGLGATVLELVRRAAARPRRADRPSAQRARPPVRRDPAARSGRPARPRSRRRPSDASCGPPRKRSAACCSPAPRPGLVGASASRAQVARWLARCAPGPRRAHRAPAGAGRPARAAGTGSCRDAGRRARAGACDCPGLCRRGACQPAVLQLAGHTRGWCARAKGAEERGLAVHPRRQGVSAAAQGGGGDRP